MIFKRQKEKKHEEWDRENLQPVLRCSICNGEQVFGFKDRRTGEFSEIGFVRNNAELYELESRYGIKPEEVSKVY